MGSADDGWNTPTTFFDNENDDPFTSSYNADGSAKDFEKMKEQQADMMALLGVSNNISAAVQTQQIGPSQEQFLGGKRKRGVFERATFNAGCSYLFGIGAGGAAGFVTGLRNAPNRRFRIRLNAVLNSCGRGARLGNSLGVIAMGYTGFEFLCDTIELDKLVRLPGSDWVNPVAAAGMTGMLYRSTAGLPVAAAAGAVGLVAGAMVFVGLPYIRYHFGDDLPLLRSFKM